MKILLQNRTTRLFYQRPGRWVEGDGQATPFATGSDALKVAQQGGLKNVQVVMKFPNAEYDVAYSISEAPKRADTSVV